MTHFLIALPPCLQGTITKVRGRGIVVSGLLSQDENRFASKSMVRRTVLKVADHGR